MPFTIIATDANRFRVEIAQNEKELCFQSYEEAKSFLDHVKEANVLPEKYDFIIEER
ncbi:hypothetical protein MUO14_02780 [Halobacillus shinanisalinarum]|uniref:Phage protein n=1 Tax=Halobacillus shinanisalinarum TaxID=2932258 RepID=A0ABY4H0S0_9BACI|nr:hypothetical protein [Halobacillus shinanisalinarum]UOQ93924.1 hypothetical protein MUO14_02780 [Halobacillus shinanisalinarum]